MDSRPGPLVNLTRTYLNSQMQQHRSAYRPYEYQAPTYTAPLNSGDISRRTPRQSPRGRGTPRTNDLRDSRARSRSPGADKSSFRRDRDTSMPTVGKDARNMVGSYLKTSKFINTYDADALYKSLARLNKEADVEQKKEAHGKAPISIPHRIRDFILALDGEPLSPADLEALLVEKLGSQSKHLIAQNWNVISSVVYGNVYYEFCTESSLAQHLRQNKEQAKPGVIGAGPIFQHMLDSEIQPNELHRVDTKLGQFIVKYRPFVVHTVTEKEMYVIPVMGFGKRNRLPRETAVAKQYAYLTQEGSTPHNPVYGVRNIHFTTTSPVTKQGHLHIARGIWLPLKLPVTWSGKLVDEDFGLFANAVGTIGQVTPADLIALQAKNKLILANEAERAGNSPEQREKRAKKQARLDVDRDRQLRGAEEKQKHHTDAAMRM